VIFVERLISIIFFQIIFYIGNENKYERKETKNKMTGRKGSAAP
jgi:hypothetical protein